MKTLGAVVLCGGKSRRMGRSKVGLPFGDEVLLQRVVRCVRVVASEVVVVAAIAQELPTLPDDVVILRDAYPDRGPLEGLAVGLEALASRVSHAFVTTTDAPFLAAAVIRELFERCDGEAAIPFTGGRAYPLTAIYATALAVRARSLLEHGERKVLTLAGTSMHFVSGETLQASPDVTAEDPRLASLVNLNTPEDYEAAVAELAAMAHGCTATH